MHKYYTILAILLSTFSCLGDTNVNAQIKKKLHAEVKSLQADITSASKEISKLRKEKTVILKNLQDMEAWGNEQEEDKFEYYESAKQLEQKADEALAGLEKEKQASKDMQERYRFIKKLMGYLAGAALVLVYLMYGSKLVALIAPALGPWGFALQYVGPPAVFGLGYFAVQLFF